MNILNWALICSNKITHTSSLSFFLCCSVYDVKFDLLEWSESQKYPNWGLEDWLSSLINLCKLFTCKSQASYNPNIEVVMIEWCRWLKLLNNLYIHIGCSLEIHKRPMQEHTHRIYLAHSLRALGLEGVTAKHYGPS